MARPAVRLAKGLFIALVCAGLVREAGGGAALAQQPGEEASVVVRAAGYYKVGDQCGGGTNPVQIRVEPNPLGQIQVGFFETTADAIGGMSKASGWLAALAATELLGVDLREHRISFSRTDLVDGPSAGALMTSGLIALLRGDGFPDDVSMTGTINPDGTIGPVGGIGHKLRGARADGITRFAIPLGQREDVNLCTGAREDMLALGRDLGIEVAEVGDVREAYAFLTGVELPGPPVTPVTFELAEDLRQDFRDLYRTWEKRFEAARERVRAANGADYPPELQEFWRYAEAFKRSGDRELDGGHEPAAFNRIWMAVLHAEFVARGVTLLEGLRLRGFPGMHGVVEQELGGVVKQVGDGLERLRDLRIESVTDAGAVAVIGSMLGPTLAYIDEAAWQLRQSEKLSQDLANLDPEDVVLRAFEAIGFLSLASTLFDMAEANRDWIGRDTRPWQRNAGPVNDARELYRSTAWSNLNYVDAVYTQEFADQNQVDLDSAKAWMMRKDPNYLAATGALEQEGYFSDLFDDDYVAAVAQLGALTGSLANAALLVAKHYSIGVETDDLGRVVAFRRETALEKMMDLAEREAERAIGEAEAATAGASTPLLAVSIGAARRNRDESLSAQDKLTALTLFWTTTLNARLIARLARASGAQ